MSPHVCASITFVFSAYACTSAFHFTQSQWSPSYWRVQVLLSQAMYWYQWASSSHRASPLLSPPQLLWLKFNSKPCPCKCKLHTYTCTCIYVAIVHSVSPTYITTGCSTWFEFQGSIGVWPVQVGKYSQFTVITTRECGFMVDQNGAWALRTMPTHLLWLSGGTIIRP